MEIGPYRILEALGQGGMGAVYRAVDRAGEQVAIKVLASGRDASPQQQARFEREARALAKVDHPNVVRLLDVGTHRNSPYLVLELHPGGSLRQRLAPDLPHPMWVASIGAQLAAGLAAVHAEGVLHRDLKPDNILIGPSDSVLLTDFGLAKDLGPEGEAERLTHTGAFMGTPGYWAPEQATGKTGTFGPATDVYGLGAVLYAALTGRAPIVGESLVEVALATETERPPSVRSLRAGVPVQLESIVMRCLEKDPAARWGSAQALQEELEAFLDRPRAPGQGGWVKPVGVALAALCLVAVGLALAASRRDRPDPAPSVSSSPSVSALPDPEALERRAEQAILDERLREAAALFRRAAEQGRPRAMFNLGALLSQGKGVDRDEAQAAAWYRRAAALGNAHAMLELGSAFERGRGVPQDDAQAVVWLRRAAEHGLLNAMVNLGAMLESGRGVAKDEAQAVRWYRRAAERGHLGAMINLGFDLERGLGVARNEVQAAAWYRRAAEGGNPEGMVSLGVLFNEGRGVTKDASRAVSWFRRGAEAGHPGAMLRLGLALSHGAGAVRDDAQASAWFRRAAQAGDRESMFSLGVMLQNGRGVTNDEAAAYAWFRRAAERGHLEATFNVGAGLENGVGVAQDKAEAVEWYRKAGEKGHAKAQFNLGHAYANGGGVAKDPTRAALWFRRAAANEDPAVRKAARIRLKRLGR